MLGKRDKKEFWVILDLSFFVTKLFSFNFTFLTMENIHFFFSPVELL